MFRISLITFASAAGGFMLVELLAGLLLHASRPGPVSKRRARGLVLFVEGIRWLGVQWYRWPTLRGLRQAGYRGLLEYWQWHQWWRAVLVLPALADRKYSESQARRLADRIRQEKSVHPDRPLHLCGVSAGCWVIIRALEMLPAGLRVDSIALLSGAVSPWRDLTHALAHVTGKAVVTASWNDWAALGLGTMLLGTADRRHTVSMGMIGPRGRANRALAMSGQLVVSHWRPSMTRWGNLGGHFTGASAALIARRVAPHLAELDERSHAGNCLAPLPGMCVSAMHEPSRSAGRGV